MDATSKRVKRDAGRRTAAKRAKLVHAAIVARDATSENYELELDGERYVDVDKLFKSPTLAAFFNKQYKRSVARLIQEAQLEVAFVAKKHAEQGSLTIKHSYSPKADVRVARVDDHVRALIAEASGRSLPLAPPVITDEDLSFFMDKAGTRHVVEMRGARAMERIFFKAKDVGAVFATERFVDTLQDARSPSPARATASPKRARNTKKKAYHMRREAFLTFDGLMHALHSTRSPVANEFRTWIYTQVFAIAYGTENQKKAMVNELCRVDKRFLEAFMKLVPNDVACLYLLDTNKREHGKRVLKFGRSSNVKDRFYKHSYAFGDDCLLDTIVFVPGDLLSEAETRLNHMIADGLRYESGSARELLLLDGNGYKSVRACMQTIADKYNGSLAVHSLILDGEVKDVQSEMREQQLRYELRINDLERMLEVMDERARAELSHERIKVAVLEQQLEASKQQLSAARDQLAQQLETAKLRLQVQELQHNALMLEKDRRLAELEMKSCP